MKPSELKKWMASKGKSATDVASLAHVSVRTIERFLAGETKHPQPLVIAALERLVSGQEEMDKLSGF